MRTTTTAPTLADSDCGFSRSPAGVRGLLGCGFSWGIQLCAINLLGLQLYAVHLFTDSDCGFPRPPAAVRGPRGWEEDSLGIQFLHGFGLWIFPAAGGGPGFGVGGSALGMWTLFKISVACHKCIFGFQRYAINFIWIAVVRHKFH